MDRTIVNIKSQLVSERNSILQIEPLVQSVKKKIKIPDESFYNILIAVTEAVNNAIVHGNKCNPEKNVFVEIAADSHELQIIVEDQGSGFIPENVVDPREPENILKENGRGLFIIKSLAKDCYYQIKESGTKLVMVFDIK